MTKQQRLIQRALGHLGVEYVRGVGAYHYADEVDEWYELSRADLIDLGELLEDPDPTISRDAYSHWCAGGAGRELSHAEAAELSLIEVDE